MQLGPHHYFEFLSLVIAIILYPRLKNSVMVAFIPFLAVVLASELIANYMHYSLVQPTVWIFNIMTALICGFYGFIFYRFTDSRRHKYFIVILLGLYVIVWTIYYLVIRDLGVFNNYVFAIASIVQILFACVYFYRYLMQDDADLLKGQKSILWIAAGVLIFNSGVAIVFSMYYYIKEHQLKLGGMPLYNFFPRYLSILLYSCIAAGIITWKKQTPT